MTREEKQKAIDALKISAPIMAVTQEEFNDYIQTLNKIMDWLEKESMLDKIRADVIARYPKNYAGEPELGGSACEFSLNQILQIIDKYKAESEDKE